VVVIQISLLTDAKFLAKKYLKNPVLVVAAAYLLYKFINKHLKKECLSESTKVIEKTQKGDIIYDNSSKKFILVSHNHDIYSASSLDSLKRLIK